MDIVYGAFLDLRTTGWTVTTSRYIFLLYLEGRMMRGMLANSTLPPANNYPRNRTTRSLKLEASVINPTPSIMELF